MYIYIPTVPKITTLDWMALDNTAGLLWLFYLSLLKTINLHWPLPTCSLRICAV